MEMLGEESVEGVRDAGGDEQPEGKAEAVRHDQPDGQRHGQQPRQADEIGQGGVERAFAQLVGFAAPGLGAAVVPPPVTASTQPSGAWVKLRLRCATVWASCAGSPTKTRLSRASCRER